MALAVPDAGRWGNTVPAVSQLLDEALRTDWARPSGRWWPAPKPWPPTPAT